MKPFRLAFGAFTLATLFSLSLIAEELKPNTLSAAEKKEGWQLLFDGVSFSGWRGYRKQELPEGGWEIKDGTLKTLAKVKGGELITDRKFNDFEFIWEWKISEAGNNGVKYLVTEERPGAPGHEYQMLDDARHPDGKFGPKRQTGSFYHVLPPIEGKPVKPVGEWNSSRIIVKGNHVEHWLNGTKVVEYELGSDTVKVAIAESKFKSAAGFGTKIEGHIMLTYHGDECWYRNMKLRSLGK
jgi:hypothetical protein